jgi:hypothetical protein
LIGFTTRRRIRDLGCGLRLGANALTVLRATREIHSFVRLASFDATLEPLRFGLQHARPLGYFAGFEDAVQTLLTEHQVNFENSKQKSNGFFMWGLSFPAQSNGGSILAQASRDYVRSLLPCEEPEHVDGVLIQQHFSPPGSRRVLCFADLFPKHDDASNAPGGWFLRRGRAPDGRKKKRLSPPTRQV